uniref:RAB1-like n=1 Tax=Gymnochlora stellata TaxID=67809 RepID=B4XPC3_GYMST|nr:RAB1-like [Gymnochlora stellata]ACF24553.1 Ras-related small GTPase Rab 1 [Gymnochlora stellata]
MNTDATSTDYDYLVKLVMVGDSGVGKTALAHRFAQDKFEKLDRSTIGVDLRIKTLKLDEKKVKMQVWDTAGQERFRAITQCYYRGADAVVLVFDQTNINSYKNLSRWISDIAYFAKKNAKIVVCANKADIAEEDAPEAKDILSLFEGNDVHVIETSAKTGKGVKEAFRMAAAGVVEQLREIRGVGYAHPSTVNMEGSSLYGGSQKTCPCTIL